MKASRLRGGMLLAAVCLAACTMLPWAAGEASAQERMDSTRIRFQQRLQRLGRAPGYDSILFVQDSVAEAARTGLVTGGAPAMDPSDTTLASLLGMPGYALTEYEAGEASFGARDRTLVLQAAEGARARVSRDGVDVRADTSIVFSEASGLVRTTGSSTFTPTQGDAVESAQLLYDVEAGRGSAFGAETAFSQGGSRWFSTGDMPFASPDSTFMSHARFTSCTLEVPHYHFETDELKIVPGKILVAWPARLYFADVPVMWLPFIVQSLSQGRSSGLLTPRFSVNDIVRNSTGYRRRLEDLGFYWAMSDYSDAELALDWFSDNYMALRGAFNYRFNRRFLQGGMNVKRYWRTEGGKELTLSTNHSWEIDERTQLNADGSFATSPEFITLNSFDQRELTRTIDSQGSLSRRFSWGALSLGASRQQSLSDDEKVVWWLPRANLSLSPITLLRAPPGSARFWNNITWSGASTPTATPTTGCRATPSPSRASTTRCSTEGSTRR